MQTKRFYKKIISLVISALLIGLGIVAYQNKWQIYDRWTARDYVFSSDSQEVADNLNLTEQGLRVFKSSKTEVDGKDNFRSRCPVNSYEEANVLGCYANRRIYVLKVDEPRLTGVEEVTAAHELLHAQFERMDGVARKKLEGELKDLQTKVDDTDVVKLIENYKKQLGDTEGLYNEIFAVYGTQLEDVGQTLEDIYDEYFESRADIVTKYRTYSAEFKEIEAQIAKYDAQLADLKTEKDQLEAEIVQESEELNRDKADLDTLSISDSPAEYQAQATEYNLKVGQYNQKVARIKSVVEEYNRIVEVRNSEALSAKSLADNLNANVDER